MDEINKNLENTGSGDNADFSSSDNLFVPISDKKVEKVHHVIKPEDKPKPVPDELPIPIENKPAPIESKPQPGDISGHTNGQRHPEWYPLLENADRVSKQNGYLAAKPLFENARKVTSQIDVSKAAQYAQDLHDWETTHPDAVSNPNVRNQLTREQWYARDAQTAYAQVLAGQAAAAFRESRRSNPAFLGEAQNLLIESVRNNPGFINNPNDLLSREFSKDLHGLIGTFGGMQGLEVAALKTNPLNKPIVDSIPSNVNPEFNPLNGQYSPSAYMRRQNNMPCPPGYAPAYNPPAIPAPGPIQQNPYAQRMPMAAPQAPMRQISYEQNEQSAAPQANNIGDQQIVPIAKTSDASDQIKEAQKAVKLQELLSADAVGLLRDARKDFLDGHGKMSLSTRGKFIKAVEAAEVQSYVYATNAERFQQEIAANLINLRSKFDKATLAKFDKQESELVKLYESLSPEQLSKLNALEAKLIELGPAEFNKRLSQGKVDAVKLSKEEIICAQKLSQLCATSPDCFKGRFVIQQSQREFQQVIQSGFEAKMIYGQALLAAGDRVSASKYLLSAMTENPKGYLAAVYSSGDPKVSAQLMKEAAILKPALFADEGFRSFWTAFGPSDHKVPARYSSLLEAEKTNLIFANVGDKVGGLLANAKELEKQKQYGSAAAIYEALYSQRKDLPDKDVQKLTADLSKQLKAEKDPHIKEAMEVQLKKLKQVEDIKESLSLEYADFLVRHKNIVAPKELLADISKDNPSVAQSDKFKQVQTDIGKHEEDKAKVEKFLKESGKVAKDLGTDFGANMTGFIGARAASFFVPAAAGGAAALATAAGAPVIVVGGAAIAATAALVGGTAYVAGGLTKVWAKQAMGEKVDFNTFNEGGIQGLIGAAGPAGGALKAAGIGVKGMVATAKAGEVVNVTSKVGLAANSTKFTTRAVEAIKAAPKLVKAIPGQITEATKLTSKTNLALKAASKDMLKEAFKVNAKAANLTHLEKFANSTRLASKVESALVSADKLGNAGTGAGKLKGLFNAKEVAGELKDVLTSQRYADKKLEIVKNLLGKEAVKRELALKAAKDSFVKEAPLMQKLPAMFKASTHNLFFKSSGELSELHNAKKALDIVKKEQTSLFWSRYKAEVVQDAKMLYPTFLANDSVQEFKKVGNVDANGHKYALHEAAFNATKNAALETVTVTAFSAPLKLAGSAIFGRFGSSLPKSLEKFYQEKAPIKSIYSGPFAKSVNLAGDQLAKTASNIGNWYKGESLAARSANGIASVSGKLVEGSRSLSKTGAEASVYALAPSMFSITEATESFRKLNSAKSSEDANNTDFSVGKFDKFVTNFQKSTDALKEVNSYDAVPVDEQIEEEANSETSRESTEGSETQENITPIADTTQEVSTSSQEAQAPAESNSADLDSAYD